MRTYGVGASSTHNAVERLRKHFEAVGPDFLDEVGDDLDAVDDEREHPNEVDDVPILTDSQSPSGSSARAGPSTRNVPRTRWWRTSTQTPSTACFVAETTRAHQLEFVDGAADAVNDSEDAGGGTGDVA